MHAEDFLLKPHELNKLPIPNAINDETANNFLQLKADKDSITAQVRLRLQSFSSTIDGNVQNLGVIFDHFYEIWFSNQDFNPLLFLFALINTAKPKTWIGDATYFHLFTFSIIVSNSFYVWSKYLLITSNLSKRLLQGF